MSAQTMLPGRPCTREACGNMTRDPSGRCHHHGGTAIGPVSTAPMPSSASGPPPPPTAPPAHSDRTILSPEQEEAFRSWRTRACEPTTGAAYVAHALFNLTPVNTPGLGTMAVDDQYRVYVDFDWAMAQGVEYSTGVLIHEVWHALRKHGERGKNILGPDRGKHNNWNLAADAEINDDIVGIVPDDSIFPGDLKDAEGTALEVGNMAEYYFAKINEAQQKQKEEEKDKNKNGEKDEDGEPQDSDGGGQGEDGEPQQGDGSGDGSGQGQEGQGQPGSGQGGGPGDPGGQPQPGQGGGGKPGPREGSHSCGGGSGVTGEKADYELDEDEAPSKSSHEQDVIANQVAQDIKRAAEEAALGGKGIGRDPSDGERGWSEKMLAAKPVDWRSLLRANLRSAVAASKGRQDYSFKRPGRRGDSTNAILPGMVSPEIKIDVAIDTSGSMSAEDLGLAVNEVFNVAQSAGVRGRGLRAFSVDSQVGSKPQTVRKASDVKLTGGGGTDMGVAIEQMAMPSKNKAHIGIVLTDGFTPWPEQAPEGLKVIIGVIGTDGGKNLPAQYRPPEWANVVYIDKK